MFTLGALVGAFFGHWETSRTFVDNSTPAPARVAKKPAKMSFSLNDAAMAGNVEEVMIRLNMGEDVNQKCFPR